MRILAIETATNDCSVAISWRGETLQRAAVPGPLKPSEQVTGLVRSLLAEAGASLAALDAVAFDCGPGAFTGLRIGCGLAQGLALGADLPVLGVVSLRALAVSATDGCVLSVLDARMGEVYWGLYQRSSGPHGVMVRALDAPRVVSPDDWVCPLGVDAAIGDGVPMIAARIPASIRVVRNPARPRAVDLLPLAAADFTAGLACPPESATPLYVRDKVALTAAEQIERRAARSRESG